MGGVDTWVECDQLFLLFDVARCIYTKIDTTLTERRVPP